MLKYYLQLFRIPNLFTVPPDIIAGYAITTAGNVNNLNYINLFILLISSIFIYIGGLITNDLFDIKEDRNQRPFRPLVSGKIKIKTAIIVAILFFGLAILMTYFLNLLSTVITLILIILILSYNYNLKNGPFRSTSMGIIRSINIVYGSSSNIISNHILNHEIPNGVILTQLINLIIIAVAVFGHIYTLTQLSKRETDFENQNLGKDLDLKNIFKRYICFFAIIFAVGIIFTPNKIAFFSFFLIFMFTITLLFYTKIGKREMTHLDIQFLVKNMVILLILLDSIFVAGMCGAYYGILTSCLLIPCIIIGKKLYIT